MGVRGPEPSWKGEAGSCNYPLSGAPLTVLHANSAPWSRAHSTLEGRVEVTENGG